MSFFKPLIGPQIVAGSTRHQTVGRINQAAESGDGEEDEDEDKDEDKDEIPIYAMLLTGLQKIWLGTDQKWLPYAVSRMIKKTHIYL